jgi:hypothetical protein
LREIEEKGPDRERGEEEKVLDVCLYVCTSPYASHDAMIGGAHRLIRVLGSIMTQFRSFSYVISTCKALFVAFAV